MIDILAAGEDARMTYALPAVRAGKCPVCKGRTYADDKVASACKSCRELPITAADLRTIEIPARYRWARLDIPIYPPDARTSDPPLIPEKARLRALGWAMGKLDGPKNALTIACEQNGGSVTGAGKSSLAAAVARYVAELRGLSVAWVHASELRGDQDDRDVPAAALRKLVRAPLSVLDGLGKELGGSQDVRGWQPARMATMMEYARLMYERDNGIRITTIDLAGKTLADAYGADFVRRFGRRDRATGREENATIITL